MTIMAINRYIIYITFCCRWDAHEEAGFCSERVEIVFRAIYETSNQVGAQAAVVHNRSVIGHITELVSLLVMLCCPQRD